ncbi:MAG TPA: PTS sugar transporter subunit IIA [Planctomycetota bacterium]|jgi:mannitol/fructose-specific phosphotransferase system IIA component (Ntr-type)|nr:PTS sugar transporter subunit IIA [Planctomycetota bacterium]OQC21844.1 MAG: PTS system fructose-specific EIIABC component [Planctomycetes bacterium ADurb.Bin069]NMD36282.1 PTS sugar transporter subunit IIA [Planctomycetota bacterium]HNR98205.1 PTS sugar transporter subunit IIA [Planctomycetota bacterium]HNU24926.1 PTS sugar transporter subunit IIA [Planctomycetota bacterium]
MNLRDLITDDLILADMKARDKRTAINEIVAFMCARNGISEENARKVEAAVLRREGRGTTGIGKGVAIPHAKNCGQVDEIVAAFGVARGGVPFAALDGEPVRLVFLVVSPRGLENDHLRVMRKIAHLARDDKTNRFLATTRDFSTLRAILDEVDEYFEKK